MTFAARSLPPQRDGNGGCAPIPAAADQFDEQRIGYTALVLDPDDYENSPNVYGVDQMSMVICFDCSSPIDSDDDPECFVEVGNMRRLHSTITLCENCRGRREDQLDYEMSIAS